ncbi:hypothetical protein MWU75_10065 [Ornithinimicrobium sp. F0845]|uniref:hypothetical protein n=1 Tax=Ornithinimicrobium sp. F0845 TaxID=2926412 RepID=UPI001FF55AEF|nr:hypothetical protein [Ornithinimicrobium sp. F0845]MCK0112482.1 hypothetical protein [Ornithinimicrobium sp. F0845]
MGDTQLVHVGTGGQVEVRTAGTGAPLVLIQTALVPDEVATLGQQPVIAGRCRVVDVRRDARGLP